MASQQAQFSDSDEVDESHVEPEVDEGDTLGDELDGLEGDDDLEDEDALGEYFRSVPSQYLARSHVEVASAGCGISEIHAVDLTICVCLHLSETCPRTDTSASGIRSFD
jgi:hypothetical protein